MPPEAEQFFPDGIFKPGNKRYRQYHYRNAQCRSHNGQPDDERREGAFLSEQITPGDEKW